MEAGLRLARCLNIFSSGSSTTTMYGEFNGHLFVCSLACALLGILAATMYAIQAHLQSLGKDDEWAADVPNVERLGKFTDAFIRVAAASVPSIKRFASHLPEIAEQLQQLRVFAANLNVKF